MNEKIFIPESARILMGIRGYLGGIPDTTDWEKVGRKKALEEFHRPECSRDSEVVLVAMTEYSGKFIFIAKCKECHSIVALSKVLGFP